MMGAMLETATVTVVVTVTLGVTATDDARSREAERDDAVVGDAGEERTKRKNRRSNQVRHFSILRRWGVKDANMRERMSPCGESEVDGDDDDDGVDSGDGAVVMVLLSLPLRLNLVVASINDAFGSVLSARSACLS